MLRGDDTSDTKDAFDKVYKAHLTHHTAVGACAIMPALQKLPDPDTLECHHPIRIFPVFALATPLQALKPYFMGLFACSARRSSTHDLLSWTARLSGRTKQSASK